MKDGNIINQNKMKPWKYIVIIVALVIISGIFLALFIQKNNQLKQSQQAFGNVQLANTVLTKTRDKLNREVSTFKAYQFTMQQLNSMNDSNIANLKRDLSYWKNLVSHTSVGSTTRDTLKVPVHDTVFRQGDSTMTARVFKWNDRWMGLHGFVFNTYAEIDYSIRNNTTIDYYWKRDHWYSKQYFAGSIIQDNPHTTTGKVVQFTIVSPQTKWYEKWWLYLIAGAGGGIIIDHYLLK
jgi:hypothetical protein